MNTCQTTHFGLIPKRFTTAVTELFSAFKQTHCVRVLHVSDSERVTVALNGAF